MRYVRRQRLRRSLTQAFLRALGVVSLALWPGNACLGAPSLALSKSVVNLGRLNPDARKKFEIEVENKGDDVLIVYSVRTDCRCVGPATEWRDVELKGKEKKTAVFEVLAESTTQGLSTKHVLFRTNDPRRENAVVPVTFSVRPGYRLTGLPSAVLFPTVGHGEGASAILSIVSPYPRKLVVEKTAVSDPMIRIQKRSSSVKPYVATFSITIPKEHPPGPIDASLEVFTSAGVIKVPIRGFKEDIILFNPRTLVIPAVFTGKRTEHEVQIRSTDGSLFRITNVTTTSKDMQVEYPLNRSPSSTHTVKLVLLPGDSGGVIRSHQLSIETDTFGLQRYMCTYYVLSETR